MMERIRKWRVAFWLGATLLIGTTVRHGFAQDVRTERRVPREAAAPIAASLSLSDLLRLSLEQNPALAQAEFEINAAQGRALQAGLYPNPTLNFTGEEIGK